MSGHTMNLMLLSLVVWLGFSLSSCFGGNPFLETTLEPAKARHEHQSWFEKEWGQPSSKAARWFGGEVWTYTRIAGGTRTLLGNIDPLSCTVSLAFDEAGRLQSYRYSGC